MNKTIALLIGSSVGRLHVLFAQLWPGVLHEQPLQDAAQVEQALVTMHPAVLIFDCEVDASALLPWIAIRSESVPLPICILVAGVGGFDDQLADELGEWGVAVFRKINPPAEFLRTVLRYVERPSLELAAEAINRDGLSLAFARSSPT